MGCANLLFSLIHFSEVDRYPQCRGVYKPDVVGPKNTLLSSYSKAVKAKVYLLHMGLSLLSPCSGGATWTVLVQ
jgi:hypothetical protein